MSNRSNVKKWWKSEKKRATAIERLEELRVSTDFYEGYLTIWVPHDMCPTVYIEIGYLLAQLGDEDFPEEFYYGISNEIPSKVFKKKITTYTVFQPLSFRDSAPHGLKFTLYLKDFLIERREFYKKHGR